jgi:hypothetical protein
VLYWVCDTTVFSKSAGATDRVRVEMPRYAGRIGKTVADGSCMKRTTAEMCAYTPYTLHALGLGDGNFIFDREGTQVLCHLNCQTVTIDTCGGLLDARSKRESNAGTNSTIFSKLLSSYPSRFDSVRMTSRQLSTCEQTPCHSVTNLRCSYAASGEKCC